MIWKWKSFFETIPIRKQKIQNKISIFVFANLNHRMEAFKKLLLEIYEKEFDFLVKANESLNTSFC